MAQPDTYTPATAFSNFNPSSFPNHGLKTDVELAAIAAIFAQYKANLALIQADDGTLVTGVVDRDSLADEIYAGINPPAVWVTSTAYSVRDSVIQGTSWYKCVVAHTSGTFATDLASGYWVELIDLTSVQTGKAAGSSNDSTPDYLENKVKAASLGGLTVATANDGGDEEVTFSVDVTNATAETSVAADDVVLIYDTSAGALRKMTRGNFVGVSGLVAGGEKSSGFTAAVNTNYIIDTTGGGFTMTMPASAAKQDRIRAAKYGTGTLTIDWNGLNYGGTSTTVTTTAEGVLDIEYTNAARGWVGS